MNESINVALAAHRFGLGETDLSVVGTDARAWLIRQIGPADPQQGQALATSLEALRNRPDVLRRGQKEGMQAPDADELARRAGERADMHKAYSGARKGGDAPKLARAEAKEVENDISAADVHARLLAATFTQRPFAERLALFWANHFTVSEISAKPRGLVGAFEREAIRPNIAGRFAQMLRASTLHPAMLRYLDNQNSIGPNSAAGRAGEKRAAKVKVKDNGKVKEDGKAFKKKAQGLNENLAREVLELHTLGAESSRHPLSPAQGYTQADVTELAKILTGWATAELPTDTEPTIFNPREHEPGPKTVLGKTYPEGPKALDLVLADLARHDATARFLATKLARHFVADEPPPALVDRLVAAYQRSDGDLPTLYRELVQSNEAWQPRPAKLKTPEEFAISAARLLRLDKRWVDKQRDGGIGQMGQRLLRAPSPAGWSDRAEDWLGPEALWKRVEWATRLGERFGGNLDARTLARNSLGPLLSEETAQQLARAADGAQALTLLLMAPEFQRR